MLKIQCRAAFLGLNVPMFTEYLRFIANRRFKQIGLPEQYPGLKIHSPG